MKLVTLLFVVFTLGCDSSPDTGTDAGSTDAGEADAGPTDVDAGTDAGFVSACPPGAPMPAAFDCTAVEAITTSDPMTGPDRTWTWVGFDNAVCMDGSSTGIGISLSATSDNVLILLEGGGACFDSISCAAVANLDGYDSAEFAGDADRLLQRGIFDRDDAANPVADWNFVYVPYCSGDVHGGTNGRGAGGRLHLGYQNFSWFLTRILPTFPDAAQVLLAGRSAGGLGAVINYPQTANAFGCTPVHLLNDGGAILTDAYMRPCLQTLVREAWNLSDVIPSDCDLCSCSDGGGLVNVLPYAAARYPDRRFAIATSMEDVTMRTFYGYGYSLGCNFPQNMPGADFSAGILGARELTSGYGNFGTYYVPGERHTFTYQSLGASSIEGTTLGGWLGQMLAGDSGWSDLGP